MHTGETKKKVYFVCFEIDLFWIESKWYKKYTTKQLLIYAKIYICSHKTLTDINLFQIFLEQDAR